MLLQGRLLIDPDAPAEPGFVVVDGGRIAEVGAGEPGAGLLPATAGGRDFVVVPAFVDAHTHLPQIDSIGCDGMALLEWLERVIFPAEAWWGHGQALGAARRAVARMTAEGTCGFAGYLTSHAEAGAAVLRYLWDRTPMRVAAGRVAMDRGAPDELTREDRERVRAGAVAPPVLPAPSGEPYGAADRSRPSANPRFAVACSEELLAEVGWFVRDRPGVLVQTHLAESPDELEAVARLFPGDEHYTAVYDRLGLLTDRTLLAHCLHLSDAEWDLIVERRSVVVHCPSANTFLGAGLFDYGAALERGARLALGSDVAAGPDVAMPRVARAMIEVAKARRMSRRPGEPPVPVPTPADAWRLITSGNAEALGWPRAGRIEPGADADLLVLRVPETWLDEHLVGRLIYNWSPDLIEARVFGGELTHAGTI